MSDAIATVDVYHAAVRYLTGIAVHNNVIYLQILANIPSPITLIFKNGTGHVLPPRRP